ncbi:MAG: LLM class flavin-dependent oxidoreductase [Chloroflexi bacterium]|nr:LLM class flavin-dependent oxidoreductase [Chloroflexota bacterium]
MQFGLFMEWANRGRRPWREMFDEGVREAVAAEEAGFDFVLLAEHHFSNYSEDPAPLIAALAIARETSRIRIGPGVAVLPEWQPLRLAEEMAVVDQLSGGRLIAGIGRGFVPFEQERFAVDVVQGRAIFNESLEVLLKAWTETDFTYEGQHVRVPQPTTVVPRPLQQPHPPLWLAGNSPESFDLAALHGMTPILSGGGGLEGVRRQIEGFREALGRHRRSTAADVVVQCSTLVTPTDAEADAAIDPVRWQRSGAASLLANAVTAGVIDPKVDPSPPDEVFRQAFFAGSPAKVRGQFAALAEIGVTHISAPMAVGGIDHDLVMRSIRLMGAEVIPALRNVGSAGAA